MRNAVGDPFDLGAEAGSPVTGLSIALGRAPNHRRAPKLTAAALISVVMPVRDGRAYLETTLEPLLAAVREDGNAELIIVDNGSEDGTHEWLLAGYTQHARIGQLVDGTISAARNLGTSMARGDILCFIDADCLVSRSYLSQVRATLALVDAEAVGSQYALPPSPHWIEDTWHALHARQADGFVDWLPAGNFCVLASTFRSVGGFNEAIITGEDAELCKRLRERGCAIYQSHAICAVHLGNPKTVRRFFRRDVWYALGMHGTIDRRSVDKPTAMMLLHLAVTIGAGIVALNAGFSLAASVIAVVGSQLLAPLVTVAYRLRRWRTSGRKSSSQWGRSLFLYWLYYWARIRALQILLFRQAARYRK